jgi:hypothetical protein
VAARLDGAVRVDQAGLLVVTCEQAKAFLTELAATQRAERERLEQQRAQVAATSTALRTRERVRRLAAKQAAQGLADPSTPAYAAMIAADPNNPLARAGHHMDEMLAGATGSMRYHRVTDVED